DGALAAYFWVERHPGKPRAEGDVRVHPAADPRLGPWLLALARECAAELAPGLPLHVFTAAGSRERKWLEAAGGRVARHYWRMTIALPDAPAAEPPVPPPGIAVERPRDEPGDLRVMYDVIETAFHDHFGHAETGFEEWLARQRGGTGPDIGLWWLARVDGEPAAALIGRAWPELGWVQGLGTLRGFRGRGLDRLLL
ncbi:MAG: mycothiol synthase, partial [Gaiellales bacterium]|nr:mycothiol synthase [Gaiellales bacterium]